jgi:hypothetical protein
VVAKIRERIAVNKQGSHTFHMEKFNLKMLNDVEGKEKYRVEVSNRFAALEDLDAEVGINTIWETIRENIKISAKDSKKFLECCGLDWSGSGWVQVESCCERGNEPSGSIKCRETTEWLHNLWPVERYSGPQN